MFEPSWAVWGASWRPLEASWTRLGAYQASLLGHLVSVFGIYDPIIWGAAYLRTIKLDHVQIDQSGHGFCVKFIKSSEPGQKIRKKKQNYLLGPFFGNN